jgi:hypothetical protein
MLALLSCLGGVAGAIAILAATGGATAVSTSIAFVVVLLGFLGLTVSRVPTAPWRPLRMALGIAAVISFLLLIALPFPPTGWDAFATVCWITVCLTSVAAAALAERMPWMTGVLLVPLGIAACALDFSAMMRLVAQPLGPLGPAVTIAYVIAASTGAAWLSALWHGRAMLAEIPRVRRLL